MKVCGSLAEISGYFSDLNGIGLSLKKYVKAKSIAHAFIFIYISTVTDSLCLEYHYARVWSF